MFCRSLFVLLAIVLFVLLWLTDSYYPFGIFKLFLFPFMLWGFMFYWCYLYLFTHNSFQTLFPYKIMFALFNNTVSLVEQELPIPADSDFFICLIVGIFVAQSLVFCVVFCISLFVLSSFLFWSLVIALSGLQFTASVFSNFFHIMLYWTQIQKLQN